MTVRLQSIVDHTAREASMMKKTLVVVIVVVGLLLTSFVADAQQKATHKYVGTKMCSFCHRGEKKGMVFEIWQKSNHALAYKTLEGAEAAKIAKEKGLKKPANESPECLKCHVPTTDVDKSLLTSTYDIKDGVQCETCHGPGSDYKSITVMKDRAKAIAAGLIIPTDDPKLCVKCHNPESPTYKKFDYKTFWAKIKHSVPKQG
jgi:nitrate/TMAO reductase-like tetraheme cytochrome c subunit